jgi:hypothetical protein
MRQRFAQLEADDFLADTRRDFGGARWPQERLACPGTVEKNLT